MVASLLGVESASGESWSVSFFNLGEGEGDDSQSESVGSESCSSYTTDSSHEFIVDDNYMIIARADPFDEEMSEMVDSVASSNRSSSGSSRPRRRPRFSTASERRLQLQLAAISEEQEEADPCEAYLRAKMTSLWTRIQEIAQKEDLSATPLTSEDAELLRAYEKKNDSLVLLNQKR